MPETPKLFRKKSKVKTWFNGLAREVLTGEDLPAHEPRVATGNTVATVQGYPNLTSDDSGSELEMEGPSHPVMDGLALMRQQFQQLQAQLVGTNQELANIKKKDKDHAFARPWQEAATRETQDPIGRVVAVLEHTKVEDSQEYFVLLLKAEKAAGRANKQTHRDLSKAEAEYERKLRDFSCGAPLYDGNPTKGLNWCANWRSICRGLSVRRFPTIP